ncbi:MAG: xanthine dehydrogenase family protein subunit M [Solirubrobacterales bacterium]
MKPAAFSYARATTVEEALQLLDLHGTESKLLAGGQSLIPLLNFRLARPSVLIDINPVRSLDFIRERTDGTIEIGALTRQRDVERSELVARACPLLAAAVGHIGHPQIRNRGTVGGSLAHADPAAELPLALVALNGEIVARSGKGTRTIAGSDFFLGLWETTLGPDELVELIRFPALSPGSGWSFAEVTHRAGDFAVVAVAVVLTVGAAGQITSCSVALSGASSRPTRLTDLESNLLGSVCSNEAFARAGELAEALAFRADIRGSGGYRRRIAVQFVRDGLARASEMALRPGNSR